MDKLQYETMHIDKFVNKLLDCFEDENYKKLLINRINKYKHRNFNRSFKHYNYNNKYVIVSPLTSMNNNYINCLNIQTMKWENYDNMYDVYNKAVFDNKEDYINEIMKKYKSYYPEINTSSIKFMQRSLSEINTLTNNMLFSNNNTSIPNVYLTNINRKLLIQYAKSLYHSKRQQNIMNKVIILNLNQLRENPEMFCFINEENNNNNSQYLMNTIGNIQLLGKPAIENLIVDKSDLNELYTKLLNEIKDNAKKYPVLNKITIDDIKRIIKLSSIDVSDFNEITDYSLYNDEKFNKIMKSFMLPSVLRF